MLELKEVSTVEDIRKVSELADIIWHECYIDNLTQKQIAYMLNVFLSPDAIKNKIKEGTLFKKVMFDNTLIGFISYQVGEKSLFLSKLYFLEEYRGNHIASKIIEYLKSYKEDIILTVNKNNHHAIEVYTHFGFKTIDSVKTDIGFGYFMDDYIMKLKK